ncbi:MAG: hypothetical protein RBU45_19695 [Myxococcota bacterium]|jgi:hypothetical protein|nr:hypothetical protein [Myxococcota bacterium]
MSPRKSKKVVQPEVEAPEVQGEVLPAESEALTVPGSDLRGTGEVDDQLLEEAISEVRRIQTQKGIEAAFEIGTYILNTFFGGDLTLFRKASKDHKTYRALSSTEGMPSHSWLYKAVHVAQLLPTYPQQVREALPFSHHALLLPEHDPEKRIEYAQKAVTAGWTKRTLEEELRKAREAKGGKRRGAPPLPPLVKNLRQMVRSLKALTALDLDWMAKEISGGDPPDEVKDLLERTKTACSQITLFVEGAAKPQERRRPKRKQ